MNISVGDMEYVVGKDAHIAMPADGIQIRDEHYAMSDRFTALTHGALAQMKLSEIDLVMMGLTMDTWRKYKDALRARYIGKHRVPNLDSSATEVTREVHIKDVRVMPQPLGGFYNYCYSNSNTNGLREGVTLVVVAGYATLDFLVLEDEVPVETRSGGVFGSVERIVRAVAETHKQGLSRNFGILTRIDDSLRTGQPAKVNGSPVAFPELYTSVIKSVVDESMIALRAGVKSFTNIHHVLLTGGGAHFFYDALTDLAGRDVLVDKESVFGNVRGFQEAGEQFMHYVVIK